MQHPLNRALAGAVALALAGDGEQRPGAGRPAFEHRDGDAQRHQAVDVDGEPDDGDDLDRQHHRQLSRERLPQRRPYHGLEPDGRHLGQPDRLVRDPGSALVNGAALIPSTKVEGQINGGAYTPFTGAAVAGVGTAGGSLQLFNQAVVAGTIGTRTDQLNVRLNLVGFPATTAGTYTGTLNVQAVVQ